MSDDRHRPHIPNPVRRSANGRPTENLVAKRGLWVKRRLPVDDRLWRKADIPNIGWVWCGVLRDRNDLEVLAGCFDYIPNSFAHQKPCHWGCKGNRAGLRVASSSPTIRYFCTRPSPRLKVTVLPKATVSVDVGSAMT